MGRKAAARRASPQACLLGYSGFVVGFWAKLYVLLAAWRAGLFVLVLAAIVLAVLGLFYYLRILSAAYMKEGDDRAAPKLGRPLDLAIALCLAAVVGLGLWPSPLVENAAHAASALGGGGGGPHASR